MIILHVIFFMSAPQALPLHFAHSHLGLEYIKSCWDRGVGCSATWPSQLRLFKGTPKTEGFKNDFLYNKR